MSGTFPIERARERLGFVPTTAVRAGMDVRTGGQDLARAVSGLGEAISDLGLKYDLKEANTQFSEYKRKVGEDNILLFDEISRELDATKHPAIFKQHTETQKSFMPTNRRAIQAANIWNNQQAPIQKKDLEDAMKLRVDDNWRAELFKSQQAVAAGTMSIKDFEAFLAKGIIIDRNNPDEIGRPLDKSEAAKILADTRNIAVVGQRNALIEGFWQQAKALPYSEAIDFINNIPDLERVERNDLITRRKRQEEIALATHNGKVYWDLERKIKENPAEYPDDVIEGYVKPNGITWEDAEKLRDLRDKPPQDPLKSSSYKTYSEILDVLYSPITSPQKVLTELIKQHGAKKGQEKFKQTLTSELIQEYDQKNMELENFYKKNPDATPQKRRDFFDELTKEPREEIKLTLFENLMAGFFRTGKGKFERALVEKKLKNLGEPKTQRQFEEEVAKIKDADLARAYYNKWAYKWL